MRNPIKNPQPGDRFLLPHRLASEEVDITRLVRLKTLKRRIAKGKVMLMLEDKND